MTSCSDLGEENNKKIIATPNDLIGHCQFLMEGLQSGGEQKCT